MTTILIVDAPSADTTALIDRIMNRPAPEAALAPKLPTVPAGKSGERYAGIAFENGKPSHHLFLLDAKPAKKMKFDAAVEWAKSVGGELPTRFESALLYANLQDQFDTDSYHWTSTQSSSGYAWLQCFNYGHQNGFYDKLTELLARAVRRFKV